MLSQDTYHKPNPRSRLKVKQKLIYGGNSNLKKAKVRTKFMSEHKTGPGRQSDMKIKEQFTKKRQQF